MGPSVGEEDRAYVAVVVPTLDISISLREMCGFG